MKYPQAYLVIHKDFAMPTLETFKAWIQPCQDFYVPRFCDSNEKLNENISIILQSHTHFKEKWSRDDQFIILMCDKIPKFLLLGLGENISEIYWVDDEKSLTKISQANKAFYKYETFKELYEEAHDEFSSLQDIISTMNCEDAILDISYNFPDNFNDVLFFSRLDQSYFELSGVLKRMTKALTHAGVLARHDL